MGVWYNLLKEIHTCKMPKADPNIKRYILFSTYHYNFWNLYSLASHHYSNNSLALVLRI